MTTNPLPPLLALSAELPKLPEPSAFMRRQSAANSHNRLEPHFTAAQMRAYATEAAAYWKEMHRAANARGDADTARLDQLERMVGDLGMLLLHHGAGAGLKITGLGLGNTGRTLRQAIDGTMPIPPTPGSEAKS